MDREGTCSRWRWNVSVSGRPSEHCPGVEAAPDPDLGHWAEAIASGAARSPEVLGDRIKAFESAGVNELVLDPTVANLDQNLGMEHRPVVPEYTDTRLQQTSVGGMAGLAYDLLVDLLAVHQNAHVNAASRSSEVRCDDLLQHVTV